MRNTSGKKSHDNSVYQESNTGMGSSAKKQLDRYLNGTFKSGNKDLEDSKIFEQQAIRSGFNQLDTQKLLELVNKYGGTASSASAIQTGELATLRSPMFTPNRHNFKNDYVGETQQSNFNMGESPDQFKHLTPMTNQQHNTSSISAKNFQDQVQKNQEERLKRVNDLKKKLNKEGDNSALFQNEKEMGQYMDEQPSQIIDDNKLSPEQERRQVMDIIAKVCQNQDEYEAMYQELENQYYNREDQIPTDDSYSVHNRLYSNAKNKQQQAIIDSQANFKDRSMIKQTRLGQDLYIEALERDKRLKAMQQNWNHKLEEERKKSKVNMKSHQLAYKKLERDLEAVVQYVNYDDSGMLDATQVGQVLFFLGVFKYLFNEQHEKQQQNKQDKFHMEPLNQALIKIEERKMREEEFLLQFWMKINPQSTERVDLSIVLQFLKLIYEPYSVKGDPQNQIRLLRDYVKAIRKMSNYADGDDQNQSRHSNLDHSVSQQQEELLDELEWSMQDLVKALKLLTDNYAAFKGVGASGIKVPNAKARKGFQERYRECTFKPEINKRSEKLEKQHWANFFGQQHQKNMNQIINTQNSEVRQEYIGRIVSQTQLSKKSLEMDRYNQSQHDIVNLDGALERQVRDIQDNPNNLRVDPTHRVELLLEKQKITEEKIAMQKRIKEQKELKECSFRPNTNKTSGYGANSSSRPTSAAQISYNNNNISSRVDKAAHERLWELSKAKRMNIPKKTAFDEEFLALQQCTFQPDTSKSNAIQRKKSSERQQDEHFIKGYDETIERLKKGQQQKEYKQKQFENLGRPQQYSGQPTVTQPFELKAQNMPNYRNNKQKPIIEIEITIATGKTAHLCIREGDNAKEVAKNFCKTYSLNNATKLRLEQQLAQYINEHGHQKPQLNYNQQASYVAEEAEAEEDEECVQEEDGNSIVVDEEKENHLQYEYQPEHDWEGDFQSRNVDEEVE